MSVDDKPSIGLRDVLYFLAEIGVYVAVFWWGSSRPVSLSLVLGIGLVAVFATLWGLLASPKAAWPLPGPADKAFRLVWFGLGLMAALQMILGG